MQKNTRILIVSLIILLGGALFSYCVTLNPVKADTQIQADSSSGSNQSNQSCSRSGAT